MINTENPADPTSISSWMDPAINVWHQVEPYTLRDASGSERNFLIAEDEFAGAAGGPVCPSGGFHVYEITGELEKAPEKVGYWNIDDVSFSGNAEGTCTAHVFRVHQREQLSPRRSTTAACAWSTSPAWPASRWAAASSSARA